MDEQANSLRGFRKKFPKIAVAVSAAIILASMLGGCAANTGGQPNGLWGAFCQLIAGIVEFFYIPIQDWGMAIIVVTIIFRLILTPLMARQTKSSYQMQKITPKMNEIKERFADDPMRQQEEMQKLYAEAKFNPLAGCIPMLFQMPIFIALFTVLRNIGDYFAYESEFTFYNIIPDLLQSPSSMFGQGILPFLPYGVLILIFAGATFTPMMLQQRNNTNTQQRNQTLIMGVIMSIMMLWIGWGSPAGVLLFWGASSLIGIAQSQITLRMLKSKDAQEEQEKVESGVAPVAVDVTRKQKKKRPKKKR